MPASKRVLDASLKQLGLRGGRASKDPIDLGAAAEIVAGRYCTPDVLRELQAHVGDGFPDAGVLMALSRGWPESDWLARLYEVAVTQRTRTPEMAVVEFVCACGPPETVADLATDCVRRRQPRHPTVRGNYVSAIVRRVQRDSRCRVLIAEFLGAERLSLQVAGARLLALAPDGSEEVQGWVAAALEKAGSSRLWPCAYDLLTGRVRCLQAIIWETLAPAR